MSSDVLIAAFIGFVIGAIFGVWLMGYAYQYSRLKKIQDEFDADRARIRKEFEEARKRMVH